MDSFNVTEDELRLELARLGYHNVSDDAIKQMQKDIEKLAEHERSKNSSMSTTSSYVKSDIGSARPPRRPLEESRQQPFTIPNPSSLDYTKYGKENYQAPSSQVKFYNTDERQYHEVYVPSSQILEEESSLYSEDDRIINPAVPSVKITSDPVTVDQDNTLETCSQTSERRVIKRKVLRKTDGHSRICDESITTESDEPDELLDLRDRLRRLPISDNYAADPAHQGLHQARPRSAPDLPSYRLPDNYEGPKALIRPMSCNPHTRNIRKTDPVSRYQSYRQCWQSHKAPGEKPHKGLRWNIREQMLYHDQVVVKKPHKVFQPNTYVVPTDKKRKALRWQVRNDMAQGIVPPSAYD